MGLSWRNHWRWVFNHRLQSAGICCGELLTAGVSIMVRSWLIVFRILLKPMSRLKSSGCRGFGRLLVCWAALPIFAGCAGQADFHLGVVTRSITGTMVVEGEPEQVQPFILVRKHNRTLIETSGGYLHRVSAEIIRPDGGNYAVDMGAEVDRVELTFLGRRHRPVSFAFNRTLGIGEYVFNAHLHPDAAWRDSYYLLIRPELIEYIIEQRYLMRRSDQLFLGEWMDRTESQFE